jgi:hypothetical protein
MVIVPTNVRIAVTANTIWSNIVGGSHARSAQNEGPFDPASMYFDTVFRNPLVIARFFSNPQPQGVRTLPKRAGSRSLSPIPCVAPPRKVIGTHPASWISESHCGFFMPVQCAPHRTRPCSEHRYRSLICSFPATCSRNAARRLVRREQPTQAIVAPARVVPTPQRQSSGSFRGSPPAKVSERQKICSYRAPQDQREPRGRLLERLQ